MILTWGIETAGALLFLFSSHLVMVAIGLFLIGAGADAAINMCFNFLGEVVEYEARQKFSIILQVAFPLGACLLTFAFIWIKDWQLAALLLIVLPSVVGLFSIVMYI